MPRLNVLRCSLAVVGFVVAAAAFGAQPATTPVTPAKPGLAATAPGDLICRNRLRPGSHIAMRTCLTAAQWAASYPRGFYPQAQGFTHDGGAGPWGAVTTTGASVGMNGFTAR